MACMLRQPFSVREPLPGNLKIPISTILHMLPKVGLTLRYITAAVTLSTN